MYKSKNNYFYLYQRSQEMTLMDYLVRLTTPLTLKFIQKVAFDLLTAAKLLHSKGIVHLDITPVNITVNEAKLNANSD